MDRSSPVTVASSELGYVVQVTGKGTRLESPAVRDFVCGAIEDGAEVVLDLSGCEYLDSTFLGCLVILHKRGCEHEDRFSVHADASARERLLHATRLDQVMRFCSHLPTASGTAVALERMDLERAEFGQHLLATHEELAKLGGPQSKAFARVAEQLRQELNDQDG